MHSDGESAWYGEGQVRVRRARTDELAELGELTVSAYAADGYLDHATGESYAAVLRDTAARARHAELLAAVDADEVLLGTVAVAEPGSAYAELAHDGELEFRMLAVAGRARHRGVGTVLTRAVLERARAAGAVRVVLCSHEMMRPAHRLYERLGFLRLPERDWEPVAGVRLLAYGLAL